MVVYNINEQAYDLITEGNFFEVQRLFSEKKKSIDLTYRSKNDKDKNTFLIQACKYNYYYIAQFLIACKVKVNGQNANGETALLYACKNRNIEIVQLLIGNNADVNIETKLGNTPLIYSCFENYFCKSIVKILLDNGANIYKQNNQGRTALMMACEGYGTDIVELLLSYYQHHSNSNDSSNCNNNNNTTNVNNIYFNNKEYIYHNNYPIISNSKDLCNNSFSSNSTDSEPYIKHGKNKQSTCMNTIPECSKRYNIFIPFLSNDLSRINYVDMKDKNGETAFIIACRIGAYEIVELLIKYGCNILAKNKKGNSGFLYACRFSYMNIVQLLLNYKINVNEQFDEDRTVLIITTSKDNVDLVRLLLEHHANPNIQKKYGRTALMHACWTGNFEIIELLLQYHADVNLQNDCGDTALMYANKSRNIHLFRYILEHGADVNIPNQDEETILMLSIKELDYSIDMSRSNDIPNDAINYYKTVIYLLIKHGANVNFTNGKGYTPLMYICLMCHEEDELMELLLKQNANVNLQNCNGDTALMIACRNMHTKIVKLLLQYNSDVTIQNFCGETALIAACQNYETQIATFCQTNQNTDIMSLLLEKNHTSINVQDNKGNTPLIIASEKGYYNTVKLLLEYKALINVKNNDGNTAIMMASRYGRNKTIQVLLNNKDDINFQIIQTLLLRRNRQPISNKYIKEQLYLNEVNLNIQNNEGYTALMLAIINKFIDTYNILIKETVDVNLVNKEGNSLLILIAKELNLKWNDFGKCYIELLRKGADLSIKNNKKKNVLYYAKQQYPEDAIMGLVDYL